MKECFVFYLKSCWEYIFFEFLQSNTEDDDNDDSKSPGKGRKKIRKILKDDKLRTETQNALKEEEERRKRIAEREREREKLREVFIFF